MSNFMNLSKSDQIRVLPINRETPDRPEIDQAVVLCNSERVVETQSKVVEAIEALLGDDVGNNNIRILSPETEAEPPSTGQKLCSEYRYDSLSLEARDLLEELHSDNNYTARIQCSLKLRSSVIKEINKALYKNYVLLFNLGRFKICNFVDEDNACFIDLGIDPSILEYRELKTNLRILTRVLRGAELQTSRNITSFIYRESSVLDYIHHYRFRRFMKKWDIIEPYFVNFRKLPKEDGRAHDYYTFEGTPAFNQLAFNKKRR